MKHRIKGRRLGRSPSHLLALKRNMASRLFAHGQIITTVAKAKELRPFAEKVITLAKKAAGELKDAESLEGEEKRQAVARSLHHRRRIIQALGGKKILEIDGNAVEIVGDKLIAEIGPRYADRPGGYTRIIKRTYRRLGDAAPTAIIALVGEEMSSKEKKKKAEAPAPAPEAEPVAAESDASSEGELKA